MSRNRPPLSEIFTEEYWTKRESGTHELATRIIPWKEGLLFLFPVGGLLGTPIFIGLVNTVGKASNKFFSKLGIKCRTSHEITFDFPYPEIVFSLVVSLKRLDINILSAEDTESGAMMLIEMQPDIKIFGGTITFEILEKSEKKTHIKGTSEVKGQIKDWGKGKQYMTKIFDEIQKYMEKAHTELPDA